MVAKLGRCRDAHAVKGQGLVLGYALYSKDEVRYGERVVGKLIHNGIEVGEVTCEFGFAISGKRDRYDMTPVPRMDRNPQAEASAECSL